MDWECKPHNSHAGNWTFICCSQEPNALLESHFPLSLNHFQTPFNISIGPTARAKSTECPARKSLCISVSENQ